MGIIVLRKLTSSIEMKTENSQIKLVDGQIERIEARKRRRRKWDASVLSSPLNPTELSHSPFDKIEV